MFYSYVLTLWEAVRTSTILLLKNVRQYLAMLPIDGVMVIIIALSFKSRIIFLSRKRTTLVTSCNLCPRFSFAWLCSLHCVKYNPLYCIVAELFAHLGSTNRTQRYGG